MPSDSTAANVKKSAASAAAAKQAAPESNVKETVESILVAFILAFIFRAFIVEAFVIPTGSMAPTLMGAHMRLRCPDCGYQFDVNFNNNDPRGDDVQIPDYATRPNGERIVYKSESGNAIYCPNCGREIPASNPDDPENDATSPPVFYGDRILVLKYLYLFQDPHRWDVVVFKAPSEKIHNYGENYIKRLVGLPGETIMILDGDVYVLDPKTNDYRIQRKPYSVQRDLWRIVFDNDYLPQGLPNGLVPGAPRTLSTPWVQPWTPDSPSSGWTLTMPGPDGKPLPDPNTNPSRVFTFANAIGAGALSFNAKANLQMHALTDWLPYDQPPGQRNERNYNPVSDLKLNCCYQRQSGDGPFSLELTKGPDVFRVDITPGHAALFDTRNGKTTQLFNTAVPDLGGAHPVQLEFANCDYRVWLRVNNKPVFETTDAMYYPDFKKLQDAWLDPLPEPRVQIIAEKQSCRVEHLSLWHDIYYMNRTSGSMDQATGRMNGSTSNGWWAGPDRPITLNDSPKEYFVMGDNSPISGDARMWTEPVHLPAEMLDVEPGRVPDEFMLGKAFFVYWPAGYRPLSKSHRDSILPNWAIIPNFGDMRSIH